MAVLLSADCPPPAFLVLERSIRRPPPPRGQSSRHHPRARCEYATRLCTNPLRDPTVRVDTARVPAGPSPSNISKKSSRSTARSPADSPFSAASGDGSNVTLFAAEQGPQSTDASSPGQVCLASHPSPDLGPRWVASRASDRLRRAPKTPCAAL